MVSKAIFLFLFSLLTTVSFHSKSKHTFGGRNPDIVFLNPCHVIKHVETFLFQGSFQYQIHPQPDNRQNPAQDPIYFRLQDHDR